MEVEGRGSEGFFIEERLITEEKSGKNKGNLSLKCDVLKVINFVMSRGIFAFK